MPLYRLDVYVIERDGLRPYQRYALLAAPGAMRRQLATLLADQTAADLVFAARATADGTTLHFVFQAEEDPQVDDALHAVRSMGPGAYAPDHLPTLLENDDYIIVLDIEPQSAAGTVQDEDWSDRVYASTLLNFEPAASPPVSDAPPEPAAAWARL